MSDQLQSFNDWSKATKLISKLQMTIDDEGITAEVLLEKLAEVDFIPTPNSELTIVYRSSLDRYKILVLKGKVQQKDLDDYAEMPDATKQAIKEVINTKKVKNVSLNSDNDSIIFDDYSCLAIVPMHVSENRVIGAFLVGHYELNSFSSEDIDFVDTISDRIAILVRSVHQSNRARIYRVFTEELVRNLINFKSETEIFQKVVDYLHKPSYPNSKVANFKWFDRNEINIILKHPFEDGRFYPVCIAGEINKKFRSLALNDQLVITANTLGKLAAKEENTIRYYPTQKACETLGVHDFKSWLSVPLKVREDNNIGYLILASCCEEHAYDNEDHLLINIALFTASVLRNYRRDKEVRELDDFRYQYIRHNHDTSDEVLYGQFKEKIDKLYGETQIEVIHRDIKTDQYNLAFPSIGYVIPKTLTKKLESKLYSLDNFFYESNYFIPLKAESGISTGFILINANYVSTHIKVFINELAQLIEFKQSLRRKKERQSYLTKFGKMITENTYDNLESALDLVYQITSKVMYTQSMYIALYDRNNNEISFPLFYQSGVRRYDITSRKLDDKNKGRTEEIILSKQVILIKTNKESEAWYKGKIKNISMKTGDYYASWVGVPILNNNDVIGVITAYHPTREYLYSLDNITFLENIASHISNLISRIQLKQSIEYLIEAQIKIAEQQHILSNSLLAQDLTHRINNSIGAVAININQASRDMRAAIDFKNPNHLEFTIESLVDAESILKELLVEIKKISDDSLQDIDISKLLNKVAIQVRIGKRLDEINIPINLLIPEGLLEIKAHYRTFFNSIYAIVDNAADAVVKQYKSGLSNRPLYIYIEVGISSKFLTIEIIDNGVVIPDHIKDNLFKYGVSSKNSSGFGLWRSNAVITSLGGEIEFIENRDKDSKSFVVILPLKEAQNLSPLAYVLDDEKSWRRIIKNWLEANLYVVKEAATKEEFLNLLSNNKNVPTHVFLDISLDTNDGPNLDGLDLIKKIRAFNKKTKIIIITGYSHYATLYAGEFDLLLEKVGDQGVLTKDHFINSISKLF